MQQAIDEGKVRYLLAKTSEDGIVTVTEYKLDPDRLQADSIDVAGSTDGGPDAPGADPGSPEAEPDPDAEAGE